MTIVSQLLTVDPILQRIPVEIVRKIKFYAPLRESLDLWGVGSATFTRASSQSALWADGAFHTVGNNTPRFEYVNNVQRGLHLDITTAPGLAEALSFSSLNNLHDGNTLFWVEEGTVKKAPGDTTPFSSAGAWSGASGVHIKNVLKFDSLLSDAEATVVNSILGTAPVDAGTWIRDYLAGTKNGSNVTFKLALTPVLGSLILVHKNLFVTRVASGADVGEYSISGQTITMGLAPDSADRFLAIYCAISDPGGRTWFTEDLAGTKDGANDLFSISKKVIPESLIVSHKNLFVDPVPAGPAAGQYSLNGAAVRMGLIPQSGESLWGMGVEA